MALAKAEAELDATRGQVRTLIATWHEALSELHEAESKVAYWNAQMERQKTLTARGIVASSKFEEVESNATAAVDRVVASCARRSSASPPSSAAIRRGRSTSIRWCARSGPSASAPSSTSPAR